MPLINSARDLAELHERARRAAAELADINERLAVLGEQVRRHCAAIVDPA